MRTLSFWRFFPFALLALFVPTATAQLTGTVTVPSGSILDMDAGAVVTSGGDLLWNGTSLVPQPGAKVYNINLSATSYDIYDEARLYAFQFIATTNPYTPNTLNRLIFVLTHGGNLAKMLVTATSSASVTIRFTTYGVAPDLGPFVKAIRNNSSEIPDVYPNYGIAPSSIFAISGNNLADPGTPVLQNSVAGLKTTLNGASITVMVNNVTTHPPIYYTSPTRIAAVLPAATPVGTGTLTVTYNGKTSPPVAIKVIPAALGINIYYGATAVATDAVTGALITYTNSTQAGQYLTLWTTGLGADPLDSDDHYIPAPHAIPTDLKIYLAGIPVTILYAGSSVYPGVDQINIQVPNGVAEGCWVGLVAVANGVTSNTTTLPVKAGGGACVDPVTGLTGNLVTPAGAAKTGFVSVFQVDSAGDNNTRSIETASTAAFQSYTQLAPYDKSALSPGSCMIDLNTTNSLPTGLAAGTIHLQGPGVDANLSMTLGIKGAYNLSLAPGSIPAGGGTYTFQGSGGADVGAFTKAVTFAPLMVWTNPGVAASIDRTKGLTVTWMGGNPGTYVYISGASSVRVNGVNTTVNFSCRAKVEDGQFTVPSYILSSLPAGKGALGLYDIFFESMTVPGLDYASAGGDIGRTESGTYQ
jgi:uncharacterized protein (TIGR03437 family)